MDGMFSWVTADDDYYDEDDAIVNAGDPLRDSMDLEDRLDDLSDDDGVFVNRNDFDSYSEDTHYDARMKAITMAGVIASSCCSTDLEDEEAAKLEEEAIEYISMEEHLDRTSADEKPGITGKKYVEHRPFEKWVQDVKAGRKGIRDPL